jgi:hypothetical protein
MKKLILSLLALGVLAALSPAPVYSKDAPSTIVPEETQAQRGRDQALQQTRGVVGSVPLNTGTNKARLSGGHDGVNVLQQVQKEVGGSSGVNTVEVMRNAEADVQSTKSSPFLTIFWVIFAGALGYGGFYALRRWLETNVPTPKSYVDKGW